MTVTADTFRRAAAVLDERGWCQDFRQKGDGSVCAVGALAIALDLPADVQEATNDPLHRATTAVERHIDDSYWDGDPIWLTDWNDRDERTADEVKAALLGTADAVERGELA